MNEYCSRTRKTTDKPLAMERIGLKTAMIWRRRQSWKSPRQLWKDRLEMRDARVTLFCSASGFGLDGTLRLLTTHGIQAPCVMMRPFHTVASNCCSPCVVGT